MRSVPGGFLYYEPSEPSGIPFPGKAVVLNQQLCNLDGIQCSTLAQIVTGND